MSRILLADDSPHAQRMGERILRDEGHEVVVVSDGKVAMLRLDDAQPDLIIADISMPEVSGFELCEYVKRTSGAPVFLTAGPVEPIDEAEVDRVRADGILRKPFEASALLESVGRFVAGRRKQTAPVVRTAAMPVRSLAVIDAEQVRAAVTVALDSAMPGLVDQITDKVVAVLSGRKS
jgi:CheY-like chemotaxis protein